MFRHEILEKNALLLLVCTLLTIAIGGIVEIVPLFTIETTVEHVQGMRPYSPLELRGRDIYVREGCYVCHSQQIRALRDEVERYGHYSIAAESMYDHPFQWGSKRIGPDLARVGGKYSNDWHYAHLKNAQEVVPESLMPHYAFLAETPLRTDDIEERMIALRHVGVPYTDAEIAAALMSINAAKGVEIGEGFAAAALSGEDNADEMRMGNDGPTFLSNHAGGVLGGISTSQPIVARVAFKPTSSILTPRRSVDDTGADIEMRTKGRHDPCVGIRAAPVVEAMLACVLADAMLRHRGQTGERGPVWTIGSNPIHAR